VSLLGKTVPAYRPDMAVPSALLSLALPTTTQEPQTARFEEP
jgi:hypothetical protein